VQSQTIRFAVVWMMLAVGAFAAQAAGSEKDDYHLDLGASYSSGPLKAKNILVSDDSGQPGASEDLFWIPLGLRIDSYYLWNSGIGLGPSIGPIDIGQAANPNDYFGIVPIGVDLRAEFVNASQVARPMYAGGFATRSPPGMASAPATWAGLSAWASPFRNITSGWKSGSIHRVSRSDAAPADAGSSRTSSSSRRSFAFEMAAGNRGDGFTLQAFASGCHACQKPSRRPHVNNGFTR